jgi:hypothetical protein
MAFGLFSKVLDKVLDNMRKKINHNRLPHKVEGNQVLWFNGEKWLVKETCKTAKKADDLLNEIKEKSKQAKKLK